MRYVYVFCLLVSVGLWAAEANLFQAGDFESSGNSTVSRSGKRSLHHVMKRPVRYRAKGACTLNVEPYAVYEAVGYVKGRVPSGVGQALYFHGWNTLGWCYTSCVSLPREVKEWTCFRTRMSVPDRKVTFIPLVMADVKDGELWLDDVSIVKIQDGPSHLQALKRSQKLTDNQCFLLSRHYVEQGDFASALSVVENRSARHRANVSCMIAERSRDLAEVKRHVTRMLRLECLRWADSKPRVTSLFKRFPVQDQWEICLAAIRGNASPQVWACLKFIHFEGDDLLTTDEFRHAVRIMADGLNELKGLSQVKCLDKSLLASLDVQVRDAEARLVRRVSALGSCVIRVHGHELSRSGSVVVLPRSATPSEVTAAHELVLHLGMMTGEELDTITEGAEDGRYPIFIGRHGSLTSHGFQVDYQRLGSEGIHLECRDSGLLLGGGQRGVLYAVYTFLEERLGCRWFAPDCTVIPKKGHYSVAPFRQVYVPALTMRSTSYSPYIWGKVRFPVAQRFNSVCAPASDAWGGSIRYAAFVHTMKNLVPWAEHHRAHPEYYALRNGERTQDSEHFQLCLTNPDVLEIATRTVLRWCEQYPFAQVISVSQNDNTNFCQCDRCMALARKEGSQMGPLLHFVNAIARVVKEKYPDKIIDTLAYVYTRQPPKFVRPESNVAIRICTVEGCFVHPLATCPYSHRLVEDLRGWSKICNRIHIWDYAINFSHAIQPFPNLRVLQPNIRFFIRHGVTGVLEQANAFSRGGEMVHLRNYLIGKLLWNPDSDVKALVKEFTDGYYGAAGVKIREYLTLLHDTICANRSRHVTIYSSPRRYLDNPALLKAFRSLFAEAEALVADDPVLLHRIHVAKLPILYVPLALYGENMYLDHGHLVFRSENLESSLNEFEKIARAEGVTRVCESRKPNLTSWLDSHRGKRVSYKVFTLKNKKLSLDVLPALGGRIWRLRANGYDQDVVRVIGNERNGYSPQRGGIEWYSADRHRSHGYKEEYDVRDYGPDFIVLHAVLPNKREMTRRIELIEDRCAFRVVTEMKSLDDQHEVVFRCHPEFSVSCFDDVVLSAKGADGRRYEHVLSDKPNLLTDRELWLKDERVPHGEWSLVDRKSGIRITNRFKERDVSMCYCNWNRTQKRVNMELWSRFEKAGKGHLVRMESEYEIDATQNVGKHVGNGEK